MTGVVFTMTALGDGGAASLKEIDGNVNRSHPLSGAGVFFNPATSKLLEFKLQLGPDKLKLELQQT
jgi:hypothetical protein